MRETEFRVLGQSADVPDGYVMPCYRDDRKRRVSLAHTGGRLYAFGDLSTSDGAPLSSGLLADATLMSECDGSRFDITTGDVLRGPATRPLATYRVPELDGRIEVAVGSA